MLFASTSVPVALRRWYARVRATRPYTPETNVTPITQAIVITIPLGEDYPNGVVFS